MPRHDNTFGGGNFDADDLDEWLTVQRDWQVDAGIEPVSEEEVLRVRERAAHAVQAVFEELGLPPVSNDGGRRSDDRLRLERDARSRPSGRRRSRRRAPGTRRLRPGRRARPRPAGVRRDRGGRPVDAAPARLRRLSADLSRDRRRGPRPLRRERPEPVLRAGHGLPARGERWELLQSLPNVVDPAELLGSDAEGEPVVVERGEAAKGDDSTEVVVAVGPAFADAIRKTINDLSHRDVLASICDGVREGGAVAAGRPSPARRRRRLHRTRRRAALRLGHRAGNPVEGHRGDPPRRSRAARQPRALRHVAAVHARVVSGDGTQCRRLRARTARRPRSHRARQLRTREADRQNDAAARARDAGRAARRGGSRARARRSHQLGARCWACRPGPSGSAGRPG